MSSALCDALCNISVYLRITLRTLQIQPLLLSILLIPRSLPLRQPSLIVRFRSRILWVEILRVFNLSLTLLRDKDLCATFGLLYHILCFSLFFPLRHSLIYQLCQVLIIIE